MVLHNVLITYCIAFGFNLLTYLMPYIQYKDAPTDTILFH